MISCFSFGFFAPYLLFDRREKYSSLVIKKKKSFLISSIVNENPVLTGLFYSKNSQYGI
jgi:hypothetical protein